MMLISKMILRFTVTCKLFLLSEKGATAIEYAVFAALAAAGIAGGIGFLSDEIHAVYSIIGTEVDNTPSTPG